MDDRTSRVIMGHDEHDIEDSELIAMGKRRVARFRDRLNKVSIHRGDAITKDRVEVPEPRAEEPDPRARVLKPRAVERRPLTPRPGAPTLDLKPDEDPHLVMTRRVNPEPTPEAARVPTRDLRPERTRPKRRRPDPTTTQDDISRLYAEFLAAVRLCNRPLPRIDARTFAARIQRQRELARQKHATRDLKMHVKVVDDRPVIFIRPR
jgi:hypothetical protein